MHGGVQAFGRYVGRPPRLGLLYGAPHANCLCSCRRKASVAMQGWLQHSHPAEHGELLGPETYQHVPASCSLLQPAPKTLLLAPRYFWV